MIDNIHILNGPNLNLLGKREPAVYGATSFEEYFETLKTKYPGIALTCMQTNHEGVLIDQLHHLGFEKNTGIILNAGGLSHTSISLRDAVASIVNPVVEVHISDIYKRESFRWHSYLTAVCASHFTGYGLDGYRLAIDFLVQRRDN
ncbi:MAG: 3-dehydroquinate dehydratase [Saprospiraceae bacterium]|nr:3-dehydroquinate dehydratase [Saprospiraceae bacterium]